MTRTGKSQRPSQRFAEPYVELHPQDATRHDICDAELVRVSTGPGAVLVRALISPRQQPGSIFVPMHWTNQFAAKARIDIVAPAMVDAVSGQPASKNIAARVERFIAAAYGFAVLADKPAGIDAEYWALAKCNGGWRVELAFASMRHDWARFAKSLFGDASSQETIAFHDIEAGRCRFACFAGDRLAGALFLASEPVAVSRDWAVEQLASAHSAVRARFAVIAGRPGKGAPDRGPTVCSCFGIGANEIAAAVDRGCTMAQRSARRCRRARTAALAARKSCTSSTRDVLGPRSNYAGKAAFGTRRRRAGLAWKELRTGRHRMAYSATPSPRPVKAFQGREEVLPGGAGSSEETAGRADFEAHLETYRGFVLFMAIAGAHVLVILLLLYWFLM